LKGNVETVWDEIGYVKGDLGSTLPNRAAPRGSHQPLVKR
jgi:hypothetical protein